MNISMPSYNKVPTAPPPMASAETLFSLRSHLRNDPNSSVLPTSPPSNGLNQMSDRNGNSEGLTSGLTNIMSFEQFKRLDSDAKNAEILRLLPLMNPLASEFTGLKKTLEQAFSKIEEVEQRREQQDINNTVCLGSPVSTFSFPGYLSEQQAPDPFIIAKSKLLNRRVTLNVGGIRHEVMWKMLRQIPMSRLGLLAKAPTHDAILELCADYSLVENEYFFDRHPRSFNTILNFYRTGKLHISDEMCILAFRDDLEYWLINEEYMESCCRDKFLSKKEIIVEEMEVISTKLKKDEEEDFGTGKFAKYQKMIWDLIEHPDTSVAAQVISVLSMVFVGISIIGMTINTLPSLQYKDVHGKPIDNPTLAIIETICISWFTLEYFIRLAGAPGKWNFLKDGMNIVDVLAIMPYFLSLFFLDQDPTTLPTSEGGPPFIEVTEAPVKEETGSMEDILQVFRIFKLARVLKLARHSPGLQAIAYTLKNSYKELGLLIFLICISGLIFSSLCYFIEKDEESGFTSIPTAFYWVVVTMTTVGYGDIFPTTGLGKLVGTFCAISGVLVLSLPIPIIAGNFERFHKDQGLRDKAEKRKKQLKAAKIAEEEERRQFCERREAIHGSCQTLPNSPTFLHIPDGAVMGRTKSWHGKSTKLKKSPVPLE
ncbi:potassium voltage-gated channel protein Shab [Eurytemora carolleeae]|uniref:potassium voltage-gated channel protein Shab n=1 Tax=Eurytemora carolleeae TaxID=1294199 RepID=UPI000C778E10|nr:potassium voltage-gated channel protein Shab [Eurytemora carolleeae]|eukprot:XP_023339856.1 potassium voltage-gated channel protein Shab-like [Eurytemora affinis]